MYERVGDRSTLTSAGNVCSLVILFIKFIPILGTKGEKEDCQDHLNNGFPSPYEEMIVLIDKLHVTRRSHHMVSNLQFEKK